ncbi:hypothetical protein Csp1_18590 [Corynebacterium provencense]|uniref:Uncharacterized protein n=1 Tax=Corynebacterium provencense TaxID=1737425 RepID=A0A2Z3YPF9_9CORY|nr:hypothetical protein Csp1_18590 [Corynebacterium provencense]
MRPGNAGANNADDHIELIRRAYRALPGSQRGGNIGHKILVRTSRYRRSKERRRLPPLPWIRLQSGHPRLELATDKIGTLVSVLPEHVKQGVLRLGADGGVTDVDTAYAADITGLLSTGKAGEYGINLDRFPPWVRVIVRGEYPAAACQLRITDVDGRRVTASHSPTPPASRRCWTYDTVVVVGASSRSKTPKTSASSPGPTTRSRRRRIRIHAVFPAGALSTWSRLLGAEPTQLAAAKRPATDMRRASHQATSLAVKKACTAARSWW